MIGFRHVFARWRALFSVLIVLALMTPAIDAMVCADDLFVGDTVSVTSFPSAATATADHGHAQEQPSDRDRDDMNCIHGHSHHAAANIELGLSQDLLQFDHRIGPTQDGAQIIPTVRFNSLLRPPRA